MNMKTEFKLVCSEKFQTGVIHSSIMITEITDKLFFNIRPSSSFWVHWFTTPVFLFSISFTLADTHSDKNSISSESNFSSALDFYDLSVTK
jgi:hypothetical protein